MKRVLAELNQSTKLTEQASVHLHQILGSVLANQSLIDPTTDKLQVVIPAGSLTAPQVESLCWLMYSVFYPHAKGLLPLSDPREQAQARQEMASFERHAMPNGDHSITLPFYALGSWRGANTEIRRWLVQKMSDAVKGFSHDVAGHKTNMSGSDMPSFFVRKYQDEDYYQHLDPKTKDLFDRALEIADSPPDESTYSDRLTFNFSARDRVSGQIIAGLLLFASTHLNERETQGGLTERLSVKAGKLMASNLLKAFTYDENTKRASITVDLSEFERTNTSMVELKGILGNGIRECAIIPTFNQSIYGDLEPHARIHMMLTGLGMPYANASLSQITVGNNPPGPAAGIKGRKILRDPKFGLFEVAPISQAGAMVAEVQGDDVKARKAAKRAEKRDAARQAGRERYWADLAELEARRAAKAADTPPAQPSLVIQHTTPPLQPLGPTSILDVDPLPQALVGLRSMLSLTDETLRRHLNERDPIDQKLKAMLLSPQNLLIAMSDMAAATPHPNNKKDHIEFNPKKYDITIEGANALSARRAKKFSENIDYLKSNPGAVERLAQLAGEVPGLKLLADAALLRGAERTVTEKSLEAARLLGTDPGEALEYLAMEKDKYTTAMQALLDNALGRGK